MDPNAPDHHSLPWRRTTPQRRDFAANQLAPSLKKNRSRTATPPNFASRRTMVKAMLEVRQLLQIPKVRIRTVARGLSRPEAFAEFSTMRR